MGSLHPFFTLSPPSIRATAPACARLTPALLRHAGGLVMQGSSGIFGAETVEIYKGDRALIMGVDIKKNMYKTRIGGWKINDSLDELERLCETAGMVVVKRDIQNMQNPSSSTFIGSGKVEDVALSVKELNCQAVVFDDELSPGQQRNLQKAFGAEIKVIDRTQLILQIFSQRARTREAKLQVMRVLLKPSPTWHIAQTPIDNLAKAPPDNMPCKARPPPRGLLGCLPVRAQVHPPLKSQVNAAQLKYMLPRLQYFMTQGAGMDAKGGSGGGRGLKGAGETQVMAPRMGSSIA